MRKLKHEEDSTKATKGKSASNNRRGLLALSGPRSVIAHRDHPNTVRKISNEASPQTDMALTPQGDPGPFSVAGFRSLVRNDAASRWQAGA
jgi:hypothetical protein